MKKLLFLIPIFILGVGVLAWRFSLWPQKSYAAEDFGIETVQSEMDFDQDGVDDYTEILVGARKDAEKHSTYDGGYVEGGFPEEGKGTCTDVIWRAFREAGYNLREMIDLDIQKFPEDYPWVVERDKNIDFRRVKNVERFLEKYAEKLTNDPDEIEKWQAGDIVVFQNGGHIGVVSDKRNKKGRTYIIHNAGQPVREEDYLRWDKPTGHYRFDAKKVDDTVLVRWD